MWTPIQNDTKYVRLIAVQIVFHKGENRVFNVFYCSVFYYYTETVYLGIKFLINFKHPAFREYDLFVHRYKYSNLLIIINLQIMFFEQVNCVSIDF